MNEPLIDQLVDELAAVSPPPTIGAICVGEKSDREGIFESFLDFPRFDLFEVKMNV